MTTVKIDLSKGVYRNGDGVAVRDFPLYRMNCFLGPAGETIGRPGMALLSVTGNVNNVGIYRSAVNGNVYTSSGASLYSISGMTLSASGSPSFVGALTGSAPRATWCETTDGTVYIAQGGSIHSALNSTFATISDADAPTAATHISYLDDYLIATDGSRYMKWSDFQSPTSWTATSFAGVNGEPEPILAHHVMRRAIYLFGARSIEVWENDGSNPFSRISGGLSQYGLGATYSVIKTEDYLYFLTDKRRLARIAGPNVEVISTPYDEEFRKLSAVSDCLGNLIEYGGLTFLEFYFPTAARSFVYCVTTDSWCEFGQWDGAGGRYKPWPVSYSFWDASLGVTILVGAGSDGLFYLSPDKFQDDAREGQANLPVVTIRPQLKTANLTHGFLTFKRNNKLRLIAKSGAVDLTAPVGLLRWSNNLGNTWSNEHQIPLGGIGQTNPVKSIPRTGIYKLRQYEFSFPAATPLVTVELEEEVDILQR